MDDYIGLIAGDGPRPSPLPPTTGLGQMPHLVVRTTVQSDWRGFGTFAYFRPPVHISPIIQPRFGHLVAFNSEELVFSTHNPSERLPTFLIVRNEVLCSSFP